MPSSCSATNRSFLVCNRVTQDWLGASEEELTRHNQRLPITRFFADAESLTRFQSAFSAQLHGEPQRFECRITPSQGAAHWVEMNINRVDVAAGDMVIVVARDIGRQRAQQLRSNIKSHTTALTGWPNRQYFQQHLTNAINAARSCRSSVALITWISNPPRFKDINNTLGHDIGDRLLKQMAQRLRQIAARPDVVARGRRR